MKTIMHSRTSLPVMVLVAVVGLGAAKAPPSKQGDLAWPDSRFWSVDSKSEEKAIDRFEESEVMGLFLDGPRHANIRQQGSLPLVVIRASSIRDGAILSLHQRGVLLSTRLEGDETLGSLAFRLPNKRGRPTAERDPNTLAEGRAVKLYRLNLSEQISPVAEQSGTWSTFLLLYDQRSNGVLTRVDGKPAKAGEDSEWLAAAALPAKRVVDAHSRALPNAPALPEQAGIVLASSPEVPMGNAQPWELRGSFALPALAPDMARAKAQVAAREVPGDGTAENPRALVATLPITIVLTGNADATPILVPLRVPVFEPVVKGKGASLARGYFAVDLVAAAGNRLQPQSYAVWAVSRKQISEPVVVRVTKP